MNGYIFKGMNPNGTARVEYNDGKCIVLDPKNKTRREYKRKQNSNDLGDPKEKPMKESDYAFYRALQAA